MKKYILLDWDGNIAMTLDLWLNACRAVLQTRGIDRNDEEIASSFGHFKQLWESWGVIDFDVAMEEADSLAKTELQNVSLYPDALYVLENLQEQHKKLALITTSPLRNIAHLLDKYQLNDTFEVVVTADDTENHKPHPEPLFYALEKLGGNAAEAIMIGDSDKDLRAALAAGIDSILFYPDEHHKFYELEALKAHQPTHIVTDFKEILTIVNK